MKHSINYTYYPPELYNHPSWLALDPSCLSIHLSIDTATNPVLKIIMQVLHKNRITFDQYVMAATIALTENNVKHLFNLALLNLPPTEEIGVTDLVQLHNLQKTYEAIPPIGTMPNLDEYICVGELATKLHILSTGYTGATDAKPPTEASQYNQAQAVSTGLVCRAVPRDHLLIAGRKIVTNDMKTNEFKSNRFGIWPYTAEGRRQTVQYTTKQYGRLPFLSELGYKGVGPIGYNLWVKRSKAKELLNAHI